MKKKNGFTLIELLAVIVILAIIALIATPIVLGLISRARKGAATDAAYGVRKEAQLIYSTALMEHPTAFNKIVVDFTKEVTINGKKYPETKYYESANTTDDAAKTDVVLFELDGTKPSSGTITISGNGTITYSGIKINGYNCTIPESGEVTCGGSSSSSSSEPTPTPTPTPVSNNSYVYSIAPVGYEAGDQTTISTARPTEYPNYLKYVLTNGEVAEGTIPEACIYSETYGGELCLKNNEFETSKQKIINYFGFNESTWVDTSANSWANDSENPTIECIVDSTFISCNDSTVYASADDDNGIIDVRDYRVNFSCNVSQSGYASCY